MGLENRVKRLERCAPAQETCPACGGRLGPPAPDEKTEYSIEWDDGSSPAPDEQCPVCGRRSVYRITFDKGG